jgi:CRISPR-associated exonuclease Cas4
MEQHELPETIPISYLNALEYCPRRFYYEFVLGEMVVNAHVLEGRQRHAVVDEAGMAREGEYIVVRRLHVWSERLRISGILDIVEVTDGADGPTRIVPIEYKKARLARWLNDHVQLCAQALCLEERTGQHVDEGYISYFGSRRRDLVTFTPELRARTESTITRAYDVIARGQIPDPIEQRRKCRDCSLEPICLPDEVVALGKVKEGAR